GRPVPRGHVRVVREDEREWNFKEQKWDVEAGETYEGETGDDGRFVAHVRLADAHRDLSEDDDDNTRFKDLHFAAYFTDPTTNRTEQRRFDLRVTREPIHVYVVGNYYQSNVAGFPVEFYVTAFYADGTPARATVAIYKDDAPDDEDSSSARRAAHAGPPLAEVRTNRFGLAKVSRLAVKPDSDDESRASLVLVARDARGRTGTTDERIRLGDGERIRVETDKTIYAEGEPVRAEIASNLADQALAVDVLRDNAVVFSQTVRLRGGRASLLIPYRKEFGDELTVAAYTLPDYADRDAAASDARVVLFPRPRALQFDVRLDKGEYKPGEDARAEVRVRDADGREVESALGVVITDRAVEERERTDREFGSGRSFGGFAGDIHERLGEGESLAGVTRRSLDQLDLSKPVPDGLDLLAEIMLNRNAYAPANTFGEGFTRDQHAVFLNALDKQLKPVRDALGARYLRTGEYPRDEAALRRTLSEAGISFDELRDPWGVPYRARFGTEQDKDTVEIVSAAADKRADTGDDFVALKQAWPYFKQTGETVERVCLEYFRRTGRALRDRATLAVELKRAGVDFDALRDRWGKLYGVSFDTVGRELRLGILSGGPDGRFTSERKPSYDDFTVWTARVDYFADAERRVRSAIDESVTSGRGFPKTEAELRQALRRAGVEESVLLDPWGRPYILSFSEHAWSPGSVVVQTYALGGERPKEQPSSLPLARELYTITVRGSGEDAKPGTADDIQVANFTRVLDAGARPQQANTQAASLANATFGVLRGTVADPNGAVIPGAQVLCKNNATGEVREGKADEEGVFSFDNLPAGTYEITISSAGFMRLVLSEVSVVVGNVTEVTAQLRPGATQETVEVSAEAPEVVQTSSAVASQQIMNLPASSRAYSAQYGRGRGARVNVITKSGTTETPRLREYFPETLLWEPSLETDASGRTELKFKLADNITTWKLSLVGSTADGRLGYAEKDLRAFRPFFVEHDPPRVLTVGDEIELPVVLHNYLERAQDVRLELKPEDWFALLGPSEKTASVEAGDAARETFDFRAVAAVKDGRQRVTAYGSDDSDAIERKVSVHPDGEEISRTAGAVFGDSASLEADFPGSTVPATARAELRIYPNLLSHVVEGVEGIMRRPYGCAEQTISSTYPSLLVLRRDKQTGGTPPPVARKAETFLRAGYERLLGMRDSDGGITFWGRGDEADTALTAYALKFGTDARGVFDVDTDLADDARDWLLKHQRADGAWPAREWQGKGEQQTVLLTAYVARVLAESGVKAQDTTAKTSSAGESAKNSASGESAKKSDANESAKQSGADSNKQDGDAKAAAALRRALDFLRPRAENSDDPYLLASFTLAASALGERESAVTGARRLILFRRDEGDVSYWDLKGSTPFHGWGLAGRIETTALAVRALHAECGMRISDCGSEEAAGDSAANSPPKSQSEIRIPHSITRGLGYLLRREDDYGV
ncbi:MAG TPA: alpha-2-macroglobulin family protein, partial [Pyrinomonadaceae bacterium]|nr:alpha-2-macroglobulin family protein [Pyrinomonadaceae bacterium]